MRSVARAQRFRRIQLGVRLAAALALLFAIAVDILADSRCHRPPRVEVRAGLSAPATPTGNDLCDGSRCVPDCFCCSTLSMSPACLPLGATGPVVGVVTLAQRECPPGIRPLPYHPPLVLS